MAARDDVMTMLEEVARTPVEDEALLFGEVVRSGRRGGASITKRTIAGLDAPSAWMMHVQRVTEDKGVEWIQ